MKKKIKIKFKNVIHFTSYLVGLDNQRYSLDEKSDDDALKGGFGKH